MCRRSSPRCPLSRFILATAACLVLLIGGKLLAAEKPQEEKPQEEKPEAARQFLAGAAASNITPPLGKPIVGGWSPKPATHVHDYIDIDRERQDHTRESAEASAYGSGGGRFDDAGGAGLAEPRHSGGLNVAYADGHAKWHVPSDLQSLTWNPPPATGTGATGTATTGPGTPP